MDKEQPSPSKTDDSTEEEIIEDISIAEEFTDSDSEDIPIFLNDDSDFAQKKRQLFDIDDDNFFLGDVDNVLSADNIAKHFKPSELIKVNEDDVKENIVPSNSDNRPTNVEKPQKTVKALAESHKELSPMSDDFILINDKKVNINSLKKVQSASAVTSKVPHENASTFSSLNYPKDTPVSVRNAKSLELFLDSNSSDESVENDNSIDEMIVERYDYNAGSSESDSEHVEKMKKKSLSEKRQEADVDEEIEEISSEVPVKKMEKINEYLKEPLDDITEEESEAESRMSEAEKTNEAEKISVIEKGNQMRQILENSLIASKSDDTQGTMGDLQEKSVRELQDIVIEKDMCLDALNSQLSALARRENFKDASGRESSKESIREYSIATTASTEYRTINDDFHVKILDIENELHERANCIEELNIKLNLTIQEREEIQAQSEKLAQEVLELRTKIAYIESPKSSDHQTVISMSQMNNFKKSLSEDESAAFSKVWNKFEIFHKTEIDQIKQNHEEEIKVLTDQIRQEKKETEVEINRLRQLLNNVKSMSPEVDALRQELEAKHQKEMEELRQYFERRCVDMEKQYSEDVFSQHVSRVEDLNSDDSDPETLPDDEQQISESPKKTPKESPAHRRSIMETSALSSAIDDDEKNLKIEEMKQSHKMKMDELHQQHDGVSEVHEQVNDDINSKSTSQIGEQNADTELNSIINEYERRLEEQVALAREDVLHELEVQIQALLSENSREDSHWPPELILLREKFTAKSQLEIAQLKIKHDEEMAKMKNDLDIQRKLKRHAAFDSHRDLDKIITERDNLRELSSSLRFALCELAKYFTHCEDEVNNTLMEEINKCNVSAMSNDELNVSTLSSSTQNPRRLITFMPDISSLIAIVEDPSLMEFISKPEENQISSLFQINIVDCLDRLKSEANNILALSEQMCKRNKFDISIDKLSEKSDSCEEEDGLRKSHCKSLENFDSSSIIEEKTENAALSLPIFLEEAEADELNQRMHELKHLLVKSEEQRKDLKKELVNVLKKSDSLEQELQETKSQLESLNSPKETFEGFGTQTPTNFKNKSFSLVELQDKAKSFLSTPNNTSMENAVILIQLIEDFCRETDRYIDTEKKDREDLQLQIDAADKQLKATRLFLEDQAVERETERDEFSKEIEQLRIILKDRDKEKASQDNFQKEIANLEQQLKDLTAVGTQYNEQKTKHEEDLKASLDKIFVLREIITDLETQIQTKSLNEHVLNAKCKELKNYIEMQSQANDSLKQDVEHLKGDLNSQGYNERIMYLEDQVKLTRPSAEQKLLVDQMTSQLKTIEMLLDRKTKTLEAFHALASTCSTTCSTPSEDVSVRGGNELESSDISPFRTIKLSTEGSALPFEEVQRILEKLSKHNRIEEATVKKVTDLEMQVNGIKSNYNELQQEKDILQERMSEQLMKISSLQSRLDEQRLRAEELTKESQADLTIRVHDLQNELLTLKETLSAREKQISNLNHLLEHSKKIIDRQEHELAFSEDNDKSLVEKLEDELKRNIGEIQRLKDKIKTEMINKVALPDLMETMLAEKNEEIENLREQLAARDKESNVSQQNTFVKKYSIKMASSSDQQTLNCYFCCQLCLSPINFTDESLSMISEHNKAELNLPINTHNDIDLEMSASSLDHFVQPFKHDSTVSNGNGFMVISDGIEVETESLGQNLRMKAELFDTLTSNSEVNHPVCTDCADFLLEMMDQQLKMAESEWNDYNNYLKKLETTDDLPDVDVLETELANLLKEEGKLLSDLEALKLEEQTIKDTIVTQEKEKKRLKNEDEKYWREYTKHRRELIGAEDEYRSLECQLAYSKSQLDKLKTTNVFNVTFHIWHSGHFGTINNFRLGRLPSAPVEWSEINAAWGQTCLLLSALSRKMNLTFKRYNLVPYGNHSFIEVLGENKKELPLYGSGGFRFFWDTKFDAGMVAFLDCLQQFKEEVEKGDSGFCLPYRMDKGKIEDSATGNSYSIKIQFNSEEQWTKALKFVLTNLKWGLAWVSSLFIEEKGDKENVK
ncbi:unnamed protein product [Diamesa tonsa]